MKNENTGWKATGNTVPQWWHMLPSEEKKVIRDVIHVMRGLQENRGLRVSRAARKWDRRITCFIKFQLMGAAKRQKLARTSSDLRPPSPQRGEGVTLRVMASPTSARSPQGASSNAG